MSDKMKSPLLFKVVLTTGKSPSALEIGDLVTVGPDHGRYRSSCATRAAWHGRNPAMSDSLIADWTYAQGGSAFEVRDVFADSHVVARFAGTSPDGFPIMKALMCVSPRIAALMASDDPRQVKRGWRLWRAKAAHLAPAP